ncbi:MAG: pilus assembly protein CpaE [Planctomycetota bacterium]|nr:pilus assembly protein CpaE [Planctomycetota bacterium]
MSNVFRVVLVDPNDSTRKEIKSVLLTIESLWLEADCSRYEFFTDIVQQTSPEIGLINIDSDPEKGVELLEQVRSEHSNTIMMVLSNSPDGQVILSAMRAGAREFLSLPLSATELSDAISRVRSQSSQHASSKSEETQVLAVGGVSGGVGSTSIAVNLAAALAGGVNRSVVLIDLDISLGDADIFLDSIPEYTLADVTQNIDRLDLSLLKKSLTKHESGVYLLPRPVQLQDNDLIHPNDLGRVIGLLKSSFTHLVFDLSKAYSRLDEVALNAATDVLLVTQLDLPCLRNVVRLMMSFEEYDGVREKTKIVVNRAGLDSGQISMNKAQETIGGEFFWQIPNDYGLMVDVRNNGVPLVLQAPKASITRSIVELCEKLTGVDSGEESEEGDASSRTTKRGLFGLFKK